MRGDINRDWTSVDWRAVSSGHMNIFAVSATVQGHEVRSYEFKDSDLSPEIARLLNDMMEALKQHRGEGMST